jgi:peptide/nickel transport system substrate-binding protein
MIRITSQTKAESRRDRIFAAITTAIALLAVPIFAGCRVNRPANDHATTQILYSAVISDPRTFNPILVTDATSGQLTGDLFETLLQLNTITTLPEPRLAEKWEIAPDNKTVTFHLRHDVKWFDGQPVTAHDVLFTLNVIYDPKVPNSARPILLVDKKRIGADAPDDYTVVLHLPKPFAPLFSALEGLQVIPAHILEPVWKAGDFNHTWGINTPPDKIIGNGTYKMVRYSQSQVVNYLRNEGFWMKDEHGGQLPRLHGQNVTIVPDLNAEYLRYLSGQIDVYGPRAEEVYPLEQKEKELSITVQKMGVDTGSRFFAFNRNPRHYDRNGVTDPKLNWFTDLKFLQAIAHMVDKKSIIDLVFHGLAVPAVADISEANKVFHNPNLKDYNYDPKLAADMLESAGYHLLRPGVRTDPKGNRLEFNLTTATGVPEGGQICTIFKQDLESLGIKVNYRPLDFTAVVDKLDSSFDWDCVLIGFTGGVEPNDGANFYRSSGNLHIWNPNQPTPATPWEAEIDTLLDEGASEMDLSKRPPYYWRIQQILHDQLPIIETVRRVGYSSWKNSLENYQPEVWGLYKPEWIEFKVD